MTLSACIMACGEAVTIERCLRSVRPYVDEICFLDTGSTDGTLEIAQRYADRIEHAEWEGFGVSRNRSYRMASGAFVLILDADEWIKEETGWLSLRQYLRTNIDLSQRADQEEIGALQMPLINYLGDGVTHQYYCERLFANDQRLEWAGSVQAQINVAAYLRDSGRISMPYEAYIHHDGYDRPQQELEERYTKRLPLYWAELAGELAPQKRAYYQFHYALCLYMVSRYASTIEVLGAIVMSDLAETYRLDALHLNVKALLAMQRDGALLEKEGALYAAMNLAKYGQAEPLMLFHAASLLALCGETRTAAMIYLRAELELPHATEGRRYEMPVEPIRQARQELNRRMDKQKSAAIRTLNHPTTKTL